MCLSECACVFVCAWAIEHTHTRQPVPCQNTFHPPKSSLLDQWKWAGALLWPPVWLEGDTEHMSTSAVMLRSQHLGANALQPSVNNCSLCRKQSDSVSELCRVGSSQHPVGPENSPVGRVVLPDAFCTGRERWGGRAEACTVEISKVLFVGETKMKDQEGGLKHRCMKAERD